MKDVMPSTTERQAWRDPDVRAILLLVAIFAASMTLALMTGCPPAPRPTNTCAPTRMIRESDRGVNSSLQDCYSCEGARGCSTTGNQWCCVDPTCWECAPPPVNFGRGRDGGAR